MRNQALIRQYKAIDRASDDHRCGNCDFFDKGCTNTDKIPAGSDAILLTKRDIEFYTDCSEFVSVFDAHHKVFLAEAWRDTIGDVFKPASYGLRFERDRLMGLVAIAGNGPAIAVVDKRPTNVNLAQGLQDKGNIVRVPELGKWLLSTYAAPFPADKPPTIFVVYDSDLKTLKIDTLDPWFPPEMIAERYSRSLCKAADNLLEHAEMAAAEDYFGQALEIDPHNAAALAGLGTMLFETNRPDEADKYFDDALSIDPFNPDAWIGKAYLEVGDRHWEKADEYFAGRIKSHPNDPAARFGQACWQMERGDADLAIAGFDKVIELQDDCGRAHYLRDLALKKSGAIQTGDAAAKKKAKDQPGKPPFRMFSASVYRRPDTNEVTGLEFPYQVRNRDIERSAKSIRVFNRGNLDLTIPLDDKFWTGSAVLEHPKLAQWAKAFRLTDLPKNTMLSPAFVIQGPANFELIIMQAIRNC